MKRCNEFKRFVKKDEKGIKIFAPISYKITVTQKKEELDSNDEETAEISRTTLDYSFGYVANWGSIDTKELTSSMEIIQKTSANIIESVSDKYSKIVIEHIKKTSKNHKKEVQETER